MREMKEQLVSLLEQAEDHEHERDRRVAVQEPLADGGEPRQPPVIDVLSRQMQAPQMETRELTSCLPDRELSAMLKVTRRLPRARGAGSFARRLRSLYLRRPRAAVEVDVLGFKMCLDPHEWADAAFLFYPHRYEHREVAFVTSNLQDGDVFLDVGANVGFYSLIAARLVGRAGLVLAIEADPVNYRKLSFNLRLNGVTNVRPIMVGVSDREEALSLAANTGGNRGASSFLGATGDNIDVSCLPLYNILQKEHLTKVDGMKIDIEGYEIRVLNRFFADVAEGNNSLLPRFIVAEENPDYAASSGEDVPGLLRSNGYDGRRVSPLNWAMTRQPSS